MQTVLDFTPKTDSRNIESYRREKSFWQEFALLDLDNGETRVSVRFYGANATVYCVVWLWGNDQSARGYGKAGGYGYHKSSAAMAEAFKAAGVVLKEDIGGRGDSAMNEALQAFAKHAGITRPHIHHSHA